MMDDVNPCWMYDNDDDSFFADVVTVHGVGPTLQSHHPLDSIRIDPVVSAFEWRAHHYF